MSSLLAGLLAIGIIGVSVDALREIGLADVEGNGLDVWSHIGSRSVGAHTFVGKGFLRHGQSLLIADQCSERDIAYRVTSVLPSAALADLGADIALTGTPGV